MGQPTKLTPAVQRKLCRSIAAGNYYEAAAASAGVTYQTFLNWMKRGEAARSGAYFEFFGAVREAEAEAEVRVVAQWQKHMPDAWQACRDFLARRFPGRWGEKQQLSGPGGGPVKVEVEVDAPDAVLRAILAARGIYLPAGPVGEGGHHPGGNGQPAADGPLLG